MEATIEFLRSLYPGPQWATALAVASVLMLVASAVLAPRFVARLPADILRGGQLPAKPLPVVLARNLVAGILLIAGVAMLVLPGQGLLTLLAAVAVSTFPGRLAILRWCASRRGVLSLLNRFRRRANVPDLEPPV